MRVVANYSSADFASQQEITFEGVGFEKKLTRRTGAVLAVGRPQTEREKAAPARIGRRARKVRKAESIRFLEARPLTAAAG
jgi:hypothetical protein